MPPLLVETYSTAAERLALNAFRIGDINGLVPCKPASFSDQKCRDAFVRRFGLRAFRRPLTDDEVKRYSAVFAQQARVSRRFLDGARVVVEAMLQSPNFLFHVEAGPDGTVRGLRRRQPAVVSAVEHDAGRCAVRGRREGRAEHGGRPRARRAAHARERAEGPRRARSVLRRVAALRSRRQCREGEPVSGVHARAGAGDGGGDAHAAASSGLERSQLHGSADGRLQLPDLGAGRDVRRARAEGSVRDGEVPRRLAARGHSRPGHVPGFDRRTNRHVADRARHLHSRAAAVPARAAAAARRHHDAARSACRRDSRRAAGS